MSKRIGKWIVDQITNNPAVTKAVVSTLTTAAVTQARILPHKVRNYINNKFRVSLEIQDDDPSFPYIEKWMFEKLPEVRQLKMVGEHQHRRRGFQIERRIGDSTNDGDDDEDSGTRIKHYFAPSDGTYKIWHKGKKYIVQRGTAKQDEENMFSRKSSFIHMSTYSRDPKIFKQLIDDVVIKVSKKKETISFYMKGTYGWDEINTLYPRSIDTVYIKEADKQLIISDIENFLEKKDWYRARSIPYRRGYLFSGPPGTGKSSFVVALATHFDLPLFVINLGSVGTDDSLIKCMQGLPRRCICLIEDIDASATASMKDRAGGKTDGKTGFSLSSLLNAIDGVYATDERIMIMTTNYVDTLDDALVRPGRVDLHTVFSEIGNVEAQKMLDHFYSRTIPLPARELSLIPAELQQMMLLNQTDPKPVLDWLSTRVK